MTGEEKRLIQAKIYHTEHNSVTSSEKYSYDMSCLLVLFQSNDYLYNLFYWMDVRTIKKLTVEDFLKKNAFLLLCHLLYTLLSVSSSPHVPPPPLFL